MATSIVKSTHYRQGEKHKMSWRAEHKPGDDKRTYTWLEASNLELAPDDDEWHVRISNRHIRSFHYLADAQSFVFNLIGWIKARMEVVGDNMEHALNVALGHWGANGLNRAVNP